MQTLPKASLELASIQEREETSLLNLPNVVGVGIGTKQKGEADTGTPCITALVSTKWPRWVLTEEIYFHVCVASASFASRFIVLIVIVCERKGDDMAHR